MLFLFLFLPLIILILLIAKSRGRTQISKSEIMNRPVDRPQPRLAACPCELCNGHIQFDATDFSKGERRNATCPHCGEETQLYVPQSPAGIPLPSPPSPIPPLLPHQAPLSVKGSILDFRVQSNSGTISGDDGRRYSFAGAEWRDANLPVRGARVDFEVREGNAVSIYLAGFSPPIGASNANVPSEYSGDYTSSDEGTIGGVCAGLAHKWGMNKGGLQVAFILLAFFWLFGLIVHIICWVAFKKLPTKGLKLVL